MLYFGRVTRRLGSKAAARYCKMEWATFRGYVSRNKAPAADGHDDDFDQDYWLDTTLDKWLATRHGRSGRPRKAPGTA
jgi:hypothetical protein